MQGPSSKCTINSPAHPPNPTQPDLYHDAASHYAPFAHAVPYYAMRPIHPTITSSSQQRKLPLYNRENIRNTRVGIQRREMSDHSEKKRKKQGKTCADSCSAGRPNYANLTMRGLLRASLTRTTSTSCASCCIRGGGGGGGRSP